MTDIEDKLVFVVVSEEWFGGEELIRVYTDKEEANTYAGNVAKKRNLTTLVLPVILDWKKCNKI